MKKKSASKSAFFNLRVLIGLCIALAGISVALLGLDAFAANTAPVKIKNHIITTSNDPLVPVGFDCYQNSRNSASTSKRTSGPERS